MFNKTIHNDNSVTTIHTKPQPHWKFVKFAYGNSEDVNGKSYWSGSFINSDDFIIHEVTHVIETMSSSSHETVYIWYEDK